ncbi:MAG: hypothetical protein Q4C87_06510 [Actinomycetaceae bacterium]|nr:hypothetical protein [Actinomycetaceae bacterium]
MRRQWQFTRSHLWLIAAISVLLAAIGWSIFSAVTRSGENSASNLADEGIPDIIHAPSSGSRSSATRPQSAADSSQSQVGQSAAPPSSVNTRQSASGATHSGKKQLDAGVEACAKPAQDFARDYFATEDVDPAQWRLRLAPHVTSDGAKNIDQVPMELIRPQTIRDAPVPENISTTDAGERVDCNLSTSATIWQISLLRNPSQSVWKVDKITPLDPSAAYFPPRNHPHTPVGPQSEELPQS